MAFWRRRGLDPVGAEVARPFQSSVKFSPARFPDLGPAPRWARPARRALIASANRAGDGFQPPNPSAVRRLAQPDNLGKALFAGDVRYGAEAGVPLNPPCRAAMGRWQREALTEGLTPSGVARPFGSSPARCASGSPPHGLRPQGGFHLRFRQQPVASRQTSGLQIRQPAGPAADVGLGSRAGLCDCWRRCETINAPGRNPSPQPWR